MKKRDKSLLTDLCGALKAANRPVRVLTRLSWPAEIRQDFLRRKRKRLPTVEYSPLDADPVLRSIDQIRQQIPDSLPHRGWLIRLSDTIETSARLLAVVGTPKFLKYSSKLFGAPKDPVLDGASTALKLAGTFDHAIDRLCGMDLDAPEDADLDTNTVARSMRKALKRMFGDKAPPVKLVDELSANALAGVKRVRIRRGAQFSDKDVQQLIQHEAGVHVATGLNGRAQPLLPILASAHPGTTRTQEGLAVFSEFITGSIDLDRLRRLADRVIAIQMAIDGADFIQVFKYFLERDPNPEQAFESSRRVFRGGPLTGGAPFTKDIVYLDGLIRVHNFLRSAVAEGRADCLQLLFCGKLDLRDIPMLCELSVHGMVYEPKFRPAWADDQRFLIAYLAYSGFLNTIDLGTVREHYRQQLHTAPRVRFSSPEELP